MQISNNMPSRKSGQASQNLAIYELDEVVDEYADPPASLHVGERIVLDSISEEIKNVRILDIGVGGGRTTPNLIEFSTDYIGIDYSAAMIAECKKRYPGITFLQCDARNMASSLDSAFGFIIFSFNGLDCVSHRGRQQILEQIFDLLEPGGLFFFSSHNLNVVPEKPWNQNLYSWNKSFSTSLLNVYRIVTNSLNYFRNIPSQSKEKNHAVWVDIGHEFRALHYYIEPKEQIRVLQSTGFQGVQTFGPGGKSQPPSEPSLKKAAHVYYLARKPT